MRRRGLTSPVPRGEHGVSRKAIAQGVPDEFRRTCGDYRLWAAYPFLPTRLRVRRAPGIPCALFLEEGQRNCKARAQNASRECRWLFEVHIATRRESGSPLPPAGENEKKRPRHGGGHVEAVRGADPRKRDPTRIEHCLASPVCSRICPCESRCRLRQQPCRMARIGQPALRGLRAQFGAFYVGIAVNSGIEDRPIRRQ